MIQRVVANPLERLPEGGKNALKGLYSFSASLTGSVVRVSTRERAAALTFDDGPHPEVTPRLLDLLGSRGARATFFLVGRAAASHRALVKRMAAEGHALGNHTWNHLSMPLLTSRWRRIQIDWCREVLDECGAQPMRLFRPPYGHQTPTSQLDAVRTGHRVIGWDAIAEDWLDDPAETLVARVERRLRPGSIVLFHDRLYHAVDPAHFDRGPTLEAVEMLLDRHPDYSFVTVPELLALGRPYRWHWYQRPNLEWLRRLL